ncbi:endonuclease/exonuclease/phosphatase family protein [Clostridium sp. 19966]|uniref:endonuclease/exonuclease/phosphatase family protein n=1 Tax=Clostridium sp. 19966 TaxID=2768166 RepID=UPI0028DDB730|nr:hypothetical protein [Clostridium sp. 19966]MDT8716064.1 endonuclease/exonuclease/phosphatase family protein [Clostridium sp. 19966]
MEFNVRLLEWNIHLMAKKIDSIACIVIEQIREINADINVIIEYKKNESFENEVRSLGYTVCTNGLIDGQNEILVAIKTNIIMDKAEPFILTNIPIENDEICPNFIHVFFYEKCGVPVSIIGVRKIDEITIEKQIRPLNRYLVSIKNNNPNQVIIATGDYNATNDTLSQYIEKSFCVKTPKHNKSLYGTDDYINNYSYFFINKYTKIIEGMNSIDHFICSNNIRIDDMKYSWSFIKKSEGYPCYDDIEKNKTVWNISRGFPDHAILIGTIKGYL